MTQLDFSLPFLDGRRFVTPDITPPRQEKALFTANYPTGG